MATFNNNERPAPDGVLVDIADYVLNYRVDSTLAYCDQHRDIGALLVVPGEHAGEASVIRANIP